MRRLLLVSSSNFHGTGYLDHCEDEMRSALGPAVERILFVPYALQDRDAYTATARARFERMGFAVDSIHEASDPIAAVGAAQAFFVGGGNTFRLIDTLHREGLIQPLRERVAAGATYMGASAGSNAACPTLKTSNDMPILEPVSFDALGLVPFQINPHYLDPDPGSTHQGETREHRIGEFLEENDVPVVGLREGSMLRVDDGRMELRGARPARVFRRGQEPSEEQPGADLSDLLS